MGVTILSGVKETNGDSLASIDWMLALVGQLTKYYVDFFLHSTQTGHRTSGTPCLVPSSLKGLAHAEIVKKSVILFGVLNMTI